MTIIKGFLTIALVGTLLVILGGCGCDWGHGGRHYNSTSSTGSGVHHQHNATCGHYAGLNQ